MRRGKIRFLAEKAATTISGAMLDEFKRKDWGEKKKSALNSHHRHQFITLNNRNH